MKENQIQVVLEFDKIKALIVKYVACSLGKDKVNKLTKSDSLESLYSTLKQTDEAMQLIYRYGTIPLGGLVDLSIQIQKAKIDGILYPNDLLDIVSQADVIKNSFNYLAQSDLKTPLIKELIGFLIDISSLKDTILRCISLDGIIYDRASSDLSKIRKNIKTLENSIRNKMNQYLVSLKDVLSENIITSRNDRFVVPVKSVYKYQVKGIIHDQSSSKQTVYIEPEVIVSMNNQLQELKIQEVREIEKILFQLSQDVKYQADELLNNQDVLGEIDFIFAKGSYGKAINGVVPLIEENYTKLFLKQARHPLINPNNVVANDITLIEPQHILLITGSNTGGKTVNLKTVGLLAYMGLSGVPVSCEEAIIPFYDNLFVDLGDEQSIEQSLSTFSSHMQRIVNITNNVTSKSLVLLDEVGSGTDPKEGESLAQSILEFLNEFKCTTIATTHYSRLKSFSKQQNYILSACVEFDEEAFKPTYRLILGAIGRSYAFEISRRLGLKEYIINNAKAIKEANQSEEDKLMDKLQEQLEIVSRKEEQYKILFNELNQEKDSFKHSKKQFETKKETYLNKAKEEANFLLEAAKNDINFLVNELKEKQLEIKPHMVTDAKRQLDLLKYQAEIKEIETKNVEYQLGDIVKLISLNREAEIVECKKDGSFILSLGGLNMHVQARDITFIKKKEAQKKKKEKAAFATVKRKSGNYECNVIGLRYEEAMSTVDKFIDDAIVSGYPSIRIVHGIGTGVLRKGVHQLLKRNKQVVSYRDGGPQEGGLGATVVSFSE